MRAVALVGVGLLVCCWLCLRGWLSVSMVDLLMACRFVCVCDLCVVVWLCVCVFVCVFCLSVVCVYECACLLLCVCSAG